MRLLIVEDERDLAGALRIGLSREGYAVDLAHTVADAEQKLAVNGYDLALLDITLPDGDGLTLAENIRTGAVETMTGTDLRLVMLTARGGLPDRVRGLDLGADDYLVKPFALAELGARGRAVLRRQIATTSSVLTVGPVRLDASRHLAHRGGRELRLTLKEFAVLRYLLSRPGHLVSAEELLEHVWDENADPFTQTVRVTVGTLRRKLTQHTEPQLLETVTGRGYRLRADEPLDLPRMTARPAAAVASWVRTVRVRLALTYSALLFGITSLILAGVYVALSRTLVAEPLDPVTVKRFVRAADGTISLPGGESFQAADLDSVQKAVNYATLQTVRDYSLTALVIMFGLSLLIGWWVAGRALRPVSRITDATRDITATDLSRRIGATGPADELRELADTIDGMLGRLDAAFTAERRLVADVSHELRNPVAVIQANVEAVLADEHADVDDRREATTVVTRATGRMSRLLDDLLASARRRSTAFADADIDIAGLARSVVTEHAALAAGRSLRLELRAAAGPVVYADQAALERALASLLANAIRLAPEHSTITVGVGSRRGWAWVSVADQGPGITAEDRLRVFDRFHRGAESPGTGLGLAIARQVVESHDGRLLLADTPGPGSTFVIWLPERAIAGAPERRPEPPVGGPTT